MKDKQIEQKIDALLAKMTTAEKIGQLNQIIVSNDNIDEVKEAVRAGRAGSLILATTAHAGNDAQQNVGADMLNAIQRIAVEETPCGIPLINGRDVIHGHETVFPVPLAMASSFNMELIRKSYRMTAEEAANDGVHWAFAPMLDVSRDPRWGRIIESPGEDPYLGGQVAKAVVQGFQDDDLSKPQSLAACAKHYIGYGASEGGRDYHKAEISDYTLRNTYLRAFQAAVDAGVATVMTSFNEISGQPVSSSKYLLTDVLRGELAFKGFVVSDWCAVEQLIRQGVAEDRKDCAEMALNAGVEMDMVDACYIDTVEELLVEGKVSLDVLDEAVRRILRVKFQAGLFEHPYTTVTPVDKTAHHQAAREMAAECMVLLKNENHLLPLDKSGRIGVIGPMVREKRAVLGSWMLDGILEDTVTILDGIKNTAPEAEIVTTASPLTDEMLVAVRQADVVVLALGESDTVTGEARSLTNLELTDGQKELITKVHLLGKPVVGVICCGRPVALQSVEPYLDAILYAWHSGSQTGNAVADILFGDVCPSGRLAATLPRVTGQVPLYYNFPSSGREVNSYYGEESSRNYEDCLGTPLYHFGYGLSYTSFAYSAITVDKTEIRENETVTVTVEVKNTGSCDGKEVVQCYIRDAVSSMTRPVRELKGFDKVFIPKGETVQVQFTLGKNELGFYNREGQFVVEPGLFEIYVGDSCLADNKIEIRVI